MTLGSAWRRPGRRWLDRVWRGEGAQKSCYCNAGGCYIVDTDDLNALCSEAAGCCCGGKVAFSKCGLMILKRTDKFAKKALS